MLLGYWPRFLLAQERFWVWLCWPVSREAEVEGWKVSSRWRACCVLWNSEMDDMCLTLVSLTLVFNQKGLIQDGQFEGDYVTFISHRHEKHKWHGVLTSGDLSSNLLCAGYEPWILREVPWALCPSFLTLPHDWERWMSWYIWRYLVA
jgi:hypothetical protein